MAVEWACFRYHSFTKTAYGHGGGIDGFASDLFYFPEDSLAVAYCTNGQAYKMNDILIGVLSIYYNREYSIPKFIPKTTITLKPEDLDIYLGNIQVHKFP